MFSRNRLSSSFCAMAVLALCLVVVAASTAMAGGRPITKPDFNPDAKAVKFFDGMKKGVLDVQVIPKDEKQGNVLVKNTTKEPVTVQLPEAFVGVHVLKQGGFGLGGQQGGGQFGAPGGGQFGQGGNSGGQAQAMGGGMMGGMGGGMMGGMGGMGGGGGGFFSIPPEKTVKMPYKSVCLEHGKEEPRPKMTYHLMKVEDYTDNPVLKELLKLVGNNKIHPKVAQAAAWHLTDNMSWRQLAAKRVDHVGGLPATRYFQPAHLYGAQNLLSVAVKRSKEDGSQQKKDRPRRRVRRRR